MTTIRDHASIIAAHPCFSEEAHHRFGRIHLPVAPACNIQCGYCVRKYDCANESRPGITSKVLTPEEAIERVAALTGRNERLTVVGIAGPGDPLANNATFEVLQGINREFPELTLCVSTNGLLLPERLDRLVHAGVRSLTITINAVSPGCAARIYTWITAEGRRCEGREAAGLLLVNQWRGLAEAVEAGLVVKVNSVYIPGVNDEELPLIAEQAARLGAVIMNILPLIPQASFAGLKRPDHGAISAMRTKCSPYLSQMSHCRQCRADACGTLGEDRDMEMEMLLARIGEEYADSVL